MPLSRRSLITGIAVADPRYQGYAQAVLRPWWDQAQPPPQVLLLRATLRQNRHDFEGALEDLAKVLEVQPYNAQAWLTRSVILTVRGDYPQALRSCLPLSRLTPGLPASACIANAVSLNGQAEQGYRLLHQALEDNPSADEQMQLWALTLLAEIAARLGHDQTAERHFEQALDLGLRDSYLLGAYADFLLDRDRLAEVRDLLKDEVRADGLLLRLALAEQRLGSAQLNAHVEELKARFQAARLRGDELHLGSEARFALHLSNNPTEALLADCARRDRNAFERLYRLTAPKLFALCLSMLRREDLAEEVLQEAYLQIWRDAARFDPDRAAAMTWMAVIVRHRALDLLRRRSEVRLWNSLTFWRSWGLIASTIVLIVAIYLVMDLTRPVPPQYVAVISNVEQQAAWLAQADLAEHRLGVQALHPQEAAPDRSFELWLLPGEGKPPRSLGLILAQGGTSLTLPPDVAQALPQAAGLAVSLEPAGGSPTGQPTGPVLYQGQIVPPA